MTRALYRERRPAQPAQMMHPMLKKLEEGDRRSIGRSNEVVAEVLDKPCMFRVVFSGLSAGNPLVRMRSADALEKITARHPEFLNSYKERLIRDVANTDQKEVRWHVAQMLPRLKLNEQERKRVFLILLEYLEDRSSIVRTFTMQALVDMARNSRALLPAVRRRIRELTLTGTPAMKARGRGLLTELSAPTGRATRPKGCARQRGRHHAG